MFKTIYSSKFGHFSVMVNDQVTEIGCAAVVDVISSTSSVIVMACNYSYTNMLGTATYAVGPAASKCPAKHTVYTSLCA